jgi:hypothetical protein
LVLAKSLCALSRFLCGVGILPEADV